MMLRWATFAILCGVMAACGGESDDSPGKTDNGAGGADSPNPTPGGTGGSEGVGGDRGSGGGNTGGNLGTGGTIPDPGMGGSSGTPAACPESDSPEMGALKSDSPCRLAGRWEEITSVGWLEVTVEGDLDGGFIVALHGEDVPFQGGTFEGSTLPLFLEDETTRLEVDIDPEGYLVERRFIDGVLEAEAQFRRM